MTTVADLAALPIPDMSEIDARWARGVATIRAMSRLPSIDDGALVPVALFDLGTAPTVAAGGEGATAVSRRRFGRGA